jgi:hypothetical protein
MLSDPGNVPLRDAYNRARNRCNVRVGKKCPFSVSAMLAEEPFYDDSLSLALRNRLAHAGPTGIVLSMPELIRTKLQASDDHAFWNDYFDVHSEESKLIDSKGTRYQKDEPVYLIIHGGGILTPDRIDQAITEGLIAGAVKYTPDEVNSVLDGTLPDGTLIDLYTFEEIERGVDHLPHRFGIITPFSLIENTKSGYFDKKTFLNNPLAIMRNAGPQGLDSYFDRVHDKYGRNIGCHHSFNTKDTTSQGRLLCLNCNYDGLNGYGSLDDDGRFVGVAPEAQPTTGAAGDARGE